MKLNDYQSLAIRTAKELGTPLADLEHAGIGFITEIGEFASEVKRLAIYQKELTPEMQAHILEEIGDVCWYIALAARALNVELNIGVHRTQHVLVEDADEYQDAVISHAGNHTLMSLVRSMARDSGGYMGVIDSMRMDGRLHASYADRQALLSYAMWLLQHCATALTMMEASLGAVMENNIAKLQARYPEKYSDAAAEARADKGGLPHTAS